MQAGFLRSALAEIEVDAQQRLQTHQDKVDGKAHGGARSGAGGSAHGSKALRGPSRGAGSGHAAAAPATPRGARGTPPASAGVTSQGQGPAAAPSSVRQPAQAPASGAKSGSGGAKSGAAQNQGRPPTPAAASAPRASVAASPAALHGLQEKVAKLLQVRARASMPLKVQYHSILPSYHFPTLSGKVLCHHVG